MAQSPPENPAQNVAPPLVARDNAIGQQEGHRPQMIRDHSKIDIGIRAATVLDSRQLGRGLQNGSKQIGVIVGVDPLEHRRHPLQTGAGVDGRVGQRIHLAAPVAVVLHEDQVPDLQIATTLGPFFPLHRRQLGVDVDKDLATGATGTGLTHGPEIVLGAAPQDPFGRQIRELLP